MEFNEQNKIKEKVTDAIYESKIARTKSNIYIGKMENLSYIKSGRDIHYRYPVSYDDCAYVDTYIPDRMTICGYEYSVRYRKQERAHDKHHGIARKWAAREWRSKSFRAFCRYNYPDIPGNNAGYGLCKDGVYRFPDFAYDSKADLAAAYIRKDYMERGLEWSRNNKHIVREMGAESNWLVTQSSPDKDRAFSKKTDKKQIAEREFY